jgi:hypothetical protein
MWEYAYVLSLVGSVERCFSTVGNFVRHYAQKYVM